MGIIAIIQNIFLPGYLILNLFYRINLSLNQKIIYSFSLSILLNYLLAIALTLIGKFESFTILTIVGLEFLIFILIIIFRNKNYYLRKYNLKFNIINNTIYILLIFSIGYFLFYFYINIGTIFMHADEIGSYNEWALQWSRNSFPNWTDTMGYPIGVPANWAINYLIINNNSIQFFNKVGMALFPLMAVLTFLDLGLRRNSITPVLAVAIFALYVSLFNFPNIGSGQLDLPAACLALIVFNSIINFDKKTEITSQLILINLLAGSVAIVKQSGLFIAILVIFWSVISIYYLDLSKINKCKKLVISILVFLLTSASWYIFIQLETYYGRSSSESEYLIKGIHGGKDYFDRFKNASILFLEGGRARDSSNIIIKYAGMLLQILSIIISFFINIKIKIKIIIFLLLFSYYILWALFFSYELRTLSLLFPFLALVSAKGIIDITIRYQLSSNYIFYYSKYLIYLNKNVILIALTIFFTSLAFLNFFIKEIDIVNRQNELQLNIGNKNINAKLDSYFSEHTIDGKIASQYGTIRFFSKFQEHYFQLRLNLTLELLSVIDTREDIGYILIFSEPKESIYGFKFIENDAAAFLRDKIESGKYITIFTEGDMSFVKIKSNAI